MSHLSLLSAAPFVGTPAAHLGITNLWQANPSPRVDCHQWTDANPVFSGEDDCALPSGIASMEHWLDLNA